MSSVHSLERFGVDHMLGDTETWKRKAVIQCLNQLPVLESLDDIGLFHCSEEH